MQNRYWYRPWYNLPRGGSVVRIRPDGTQFIRYNEGYEENIILCANNYYLAQVFEDENTKIIHEADGKHYAVDANGKIKAQVYTTEYAQGFKTLVEYNGKKITLNPSDKVYPRNGGYFIHKSYGPRIPVLSMNDYNEIHKKIPRTNENGHLQIPYLYNVPPPTLLNQSNTSPQTHQPHQTTANNNDKIPCYNHLSSRLFNNDSSNQMTDDPQHQNTHVAKGHGFGQ